MHCNTQVIGAMGAMDSIITVDPDPQADLKHVRAPPLLPALLAPPRLFSYLFLPTCLPACPPCLPACLSC